MAVMLPQQKCTARGREGEFWGVEKIGVKGDSLGVSCRWWVEWNRIVFDFSYGAFLEYNRMSQAVCMLCVLFPYASNSDKLLTFVHFSPLQTWRYWGGIKFDLFANWQGFCANPFIEFMPKMPFTEMLNWTQHFWKVHKLALVGKFQVSVANNFCNFATSWTYSIQDENPGCRRGKKKWQSLSSITAKNIFTPIIKRLWGASVDVL